jgi:hypothetical protein
VSLAFYLDHHVPAAIAAGLRQLQIDVLTVAEDGKAEWDDDQLLERALELGRIVFTQDRDFLVLAARVAGATERCPSPEDYGAERNCLATLIMGIRCVTVGPGGPLQPGAISRISPSSSSGRRFESFTISGVTSRHRSPPSRLPVAA